MGSDMGGGGHIMLTLNADGNRLNLGNFNETGLNCNNNWNDNRNSNLGVFPLMVCQEKEDGTSPSSFYSLLISPPTIRPTVDNFSANSAYLVLSSVFISQRIVIKYFK